MFEFLMPNLDVTMEEGSVIQWLKKEGDAVEEGEHLLDVESEKVVMEVESPYAGVLRRIVVEEGETVPVGTLIAYIGEESEELPDSPSKPEVGIPVTKHTLVSHEELVHDKPSEPRRVTVEGRPIKASPLAKKTAKEHGIDLSLLTGTGPAGRIVERDVLHAIEESELGVTSGASYEPDLREKETIPLSPTRKVVARLMTESFRTPHFYISLEVDAHELQQTRKRLIPVIESEIGVRLTITDLIVKAVANALEDNPTVNCAYGNGVVKLFKEINIGLITAVEGGVVSPVIRRANERSLLEIAQFRAELVEKARDRKLTKEEMTGSTFSISNMGMFGVDQFSAILQPPEAGILAVGRLAEKAVVCEGKIVIRPVMMLTLSIDHRVLDAGTGAVFLSCLKRYIECQNESLNEKTL